MKRKRISLFISGIRKWWKKFEWPVVISLGLLSALLGYIGLFKQLPSGIESRSVSNILYRILQMFFVDSGFLEGIEPPVCRELDIARFLAPLTLTYTAIQALGILFSEQIVALRLMMTRNHAIICGLGGKGDAIASHFLEAGIKVVIIELDVENDLFRQARQRGAIVLLGDATDADLLIKAGVRRARYLINVCGDDGINTEIAVVARRICKKHASGMVLNCIAHIVDPQLCVLLRKFEIESVDEGAFRLDFFNIYESGSRAILQEYPASPRSLIVGFGRMGRSLLLAIVQDIHHSWKGKAVDLHFTVIDRKAKSLTESLRLSWPHLDKKCKIEPIDIDITSYGYEKAGFLFDDKGNCRFDNIYVCLDTDSFSLSAALKLHRHLIDHKAAIIIRMNRDSGLANLFHIEAPSRFENLHPFSLMEKTCKLDMILGGTHEILAQAIHENYLMGEMRKGSTFQDNPSMIPWDELPEQLKESNRLQADHIGAKLRAINCSVFPMIFPEEDNFQFSPGEIEELAIIEHDRWMKERIMKGWRYGPEKDLKKKTSPYLVPFEQLPEDVKQKDRDSVSGLPGLLGKAGLGIYRIT